MLMSIYVRMSPILAAFFLMTSVVFFAMCLWRGEIILGLQSDALKNKDQEIKVVIEQHEGANKVSQEYEVRKADKEQEKVYVDREVEKIVYISSYSNLCLDDIGLSQLNGRISSVNGSRKLEDAMPSTTGAK